MKYVPEIFGSNATLEQTIRSRSQTPDDLYPMSRQGVKVGPGVDACNFNALHPLVQDFWVEAFGELADKLRDSPAFAGVTVRGMCGATMDSSRFPQFIGAIATGPWPSSRGKQE